jgi:hypothetical protein
VGIIARNSDFRAAQEDAPDLWHDVYHALMGRIATIPNNG